jgi:hypothetical protein
MNGRVERLWHRVARHRPWSGSAKPEDWNPRVGTRRFLLWHVFCYECAYERVNGGPR